MSITFYGIPNCDTVKKARVWLDGKGLAYAFHDYKKAGADAEKLGAHAFLNTDDKDAMKAKRGYFDMVLNTIPVRHDVVPYLHLLRIDGVQVLVGRLREHRLQLDHQIGCALHQFAEAPVLVGQLAFPFQVLARGRRLIAEFDVVQCRRQGALVDQPS